MRVSLSALLTLSVLAALRTARGADPAAAPGAPAAALGDPAADDDADVEPGAYVVILEHENERQCSASLISLRIAVTTASCARGESGAPLWALAALLPAAPLPASTALLAAASRRVARVVLAGDGRDPTDPALDFAVVELEEPFGAAAHARPVVQDTERGCGADECYVQRSLATTTRRTRFRVAQVSRAPPERCAAHVPHWAATQPQLLCFAGDELCERDVGAGVLCAGQLCGALSSLAGAHCAGAFAVQRVSRWRHFLHCAFTLGLCGRGTCARVCTERRLLQDDFDSPITLFSSDLNVSSYNPLYVPTSATPRAAPYGRFPPMSGAGGAGSTGGGGRAGGAGGTEMTKGFRSEMEFEPNRADFKVTPSRTSRVGLKAGEYGDNAAEYGADEAAAPAGPTVPSATPTPTPPPSTRPPAPALPLHSPSKASSVSHVLTTIASQMCIHVSILVLI